MTHIEQLTEALKAEGIDAAAWIKNGRSRIYLNGHGRDIKAWIEMDDPEGDGSEYVDELYSGCNLKVYSNANQDQKWLTNRSKQIKHSIMLRLHEAATDGELKSPLLASPICDDWRDVILS